MNNHTKNLTLKCSLTTTHCMVLWLILSLQSWGLKFSVMVFFWRNLRSLFNSEIKWNHCAVSWLYIGFVRYMNLSVEPYTDWLSMNCYVYVIPIIAEGTVAKCTSCKVVYCLDKRLRILKYLKGAQCLVSRLLEATFPHEALRNSCDYVSNHVVHSTNDLFVFKAFKSRNIHHLYLWILSWLHTRAPFWKVPLTASAIFFHYIWI